MNLAPICKLFLNFSNIAGPGEDYDELRFVVNRRDFTVGKNLIAESAVPAGEKLNSTAK
jgi:hypothetical protein